MNNDDTIAAIGTPPGQGGISIVRVSGPDALVMVDRVFRCPGPPLSARPGGTFVHGYLHQDGRDLDEVLALIMRSPRSYTGQDMVEIQGHGGTVCARRNLRLILDAGARTAEPGEFTRRAFLSGRLDLLQAEAVLDLIGAQSSRAADSALEQLEGRLSVTFNGIYNELVQIAADLEATLDFPEDELPQYVLPKIIQDIRSTQARFDALLSSWDEGHLLREGAVVVIAGRPNVGKSTMLNSLLGRQRAIVSSSPGTTRDILEEAFVVNGFPVRLVDTAGLREAPEEIEAEGIRRAKSRISSADLVLFMMDASAQPTSEELATVSALDPAKTIFVLNKSDRLISNRGAVGSKPPILTNLLTGAGLDDVVASIGAHLGAHAGGAVSHATISERHRRLLLDARSHLLDVFQALETKQEELVAPASEQLRDALRLLGEATGREYHEELLNQIFSKFCIGK